MNLTSLDSLGSCESIYVYFKTPHKTGRNMNSITLKTTGTQSSIYFDHSPVNTEWLEKPKYRAFNISFQISLLYI